MNILSAEEISKNFNDRWLFKNITVGISQGQKVALVGVNGSGKSTLLKILSGKVSSDSGSVTFRKGISVAYLDQNPEFNEEHTVLEALFAVQTEVMKLVEEYEKCLIDPALSDRLQTVMERMNDLNAWDYEAKVKEIISRMGLTNLDQKINTLSGGQRKRVAMARVLIEDPEFLILDEPTNHLDLETIEWLEGFLSARNQTLLLVTHDRYFLDAVADEILELGDGNIYKYKGDYTYFIEKKAERELQAATEIDKAKNLLKKELDWMRKQPRARGTKQKARIDAFYELKEKATVKKADAKLELSVKTTRLGGKIIEVDKISKAYQDKKLLDNFSYVFKKLDKIGIIGKNGVGKTTFLNMLTGADSPDSGKMEVGQTAKFGYFSQAGMEFKENMRVIEAVKEVAEIIELASGEIVSASKFLEHFLFSPALQYGMISKLSGGEKKRLQLLMILIKNPNFLILDEPTNDLDLITLSVLEDFLQKFTGCLMIVSHDRYFMDKLCEHLFVFEGEGIIRDFPGNYTQYRDWAEEQEALKAYEKANPEPEVKTNNNSKKLSFNEKKEYETLEKEISDLEEKKDTLIEKMNSGAGSHDEIAAWAKEHDLLTKSLEQKTERWLELADKV